MELMRKKVYIATPISKGDLLHNIRQAEVAFLELAVAGFAPFNPVLSVYAGGAAQVVRSVWAVAERGSSLPLSHADWMDIDLSWVAVSDAVLRLPAESVGADLETAHAERCGVPVFHDIESLVAHFGVRA